MSEPVFDPRHFKDWLHQNGHGEFARWIDAVTQELVPEGQLMGNDVKDLRTSVASLQTTVSDVAGSGGSAPSEDEAGAINAGPTSSTVGAASITHSDDGTISGVSNGNDIAVVATGVFSATQVVTADPGASGVFSGTLTVTRDKGGGGAATWKTPVAAVGTKTVTYLGYEDTVPPTQRWRVTEYLSATFSETDDDGTTDYRVFAADLSVTGATLSGTNTRTISSSEPA